MKITQLTLIFAFLAFGTLQASNTTCYDCIANQATIEAAIAQLDGDPEEDELSEMVLKVESIVDNERKAKKLKRQLARVNGVENVSACTQSGTVRIAYSKPEMGCCSHLHSAMADKGWEYEMVSNEERPACGKKKKKGNCQGHGNSAS